MAIKTFLVQYWSPSGQKIWGRKKGETADSVNAALLNDGFLPVLVIPDFFEFINKTRNAGLSDTVCGDMFRELAGLTDSTGSIIKALFHMHQRTDRKASKFRYKSIVKNFINDAVNLYYKDKYKNKNKFLTAAREDIDAGLTLSTTLKAFEFDEFAVSLTDVAEKAGDLPGIFRKIAGYYETKRGYKKSFLSAMSYPAGLFALLSVVFLVFLFYVIPAFGTFFKSFPHIPARTLFVINLFASLRRFFMVYTGLLLIASISLLYIWITNWKNIRHRVFNKLATLPVIGFFFKFNYLRWYFYQFSVLLSAGQTPLSIMDYLRKTTSNEYFQNKFDIIYANLIAGGSLADAFAASE
ncbi:MAG: type II secretion system F family protein, partial [bacterium]